MNNEIETQINNLFSGDISSDEARNIDAQLQHYRNQTGAWHTAVTILNDQNPSPHMQWFCFSVIEAAVGTKWDSISETDQYNLRDFLVFYHKERSSNLNSIASNKLNKTLVDVAKHLWPDNFEQLLPLIHEYILNKDTRIKGLSLLKTLVDEFGSNKPDISSQKRRQLKQMLANQGSQILALLKQILDYAYDNPSENFSEYSLQNGKMLSGQSIYPSPNESSDEWPPRRPSGAFDKQLTDICVVSLDTLLSCLQWMPLEQLVGQPLVDSILKYCHLIDSGSIEMATSAMGCMNELMLRKWNSKEFYSLLPTVFRHLYEIVRYLTNESDDRIMDDLEENYRTKLLDFLKYFVHSYINHMENNPYVPTVDFLQVFYKFTFLQPDIYGFRECLEIWDDFLQSVTQRQNPAMSIQIYEGVLLSLSKDMIAKAQFTLNAAELSDVEDSLENIDGQTDYDLFLDELLDIFMKLSEFYPNNVIGDLYMAIDRLIDSLAQLLHQDPGPRKSLSQTAHDFYVFKDLRSFLRVFGQLAHKFAESFEETLDATLELQGKYLKSIELCLSGLPVNQSIPDYVKLASESYGVISAYTPWFIRLQQYGTSDPQAMEKFDSLCSNIISACIAVFKPESPTKVTDSAAQLFRLVVTNVKPANFFRYQEVVNFLPYIHSATANLSSRTKKELYYSISNACLTLVPSASDNATSSEFNNFIAVIINPYIELSKSEEFFTQRQHENSLIRNQLAHVVVVLTAFIQSVAKEKAPVKKILYDSIKETVPFTLQLLSLFANDSEMLLLVMEFCKEMFMSLKSQLGQKVLGEVLTSHFALFTSENIKAALDKDQSYGIELLNGFLGLLKLVVEDNSKISRGFIQDIIQFSLDQCAPILLLGESETKANVRAAFFDLIHGSLSQNWRFFFPMRAPNPDGSVNFDPEKLVIFNRLMEIVGSGFQFSSLETVKQSLEILDDLNKRCRLFQHPAFKNSGISAAFIDGILSCLIRKSHDSLRDEFINTAYGMAEVDFDLFYTQIIHQFLAERNDLTNDHKNQLIYSLDQPKDSPTFSANLSGFVDDLIYFSRMDSFLSSTHS